MRRIVMFNWVTADGYFAGPDGNLDWVVPDDEQAKAAAEGLPGCDTVLFGRVTYQLFEGFWRPAVEDSPTGIRWRPLLSQAARHQQRLPRHVLRIGRRQIHRRR